MLGDYLCLDPSCFVSLENWKNTRNLLEQSEFRGYHIVIPDRVYDAIQYEPPQKFKKLDNILRDWNFKVIESEQDEYVRITRFMLQKYFLIPSSHYLGGLEKIGKDSIEIDLLIQRFGEITGKILFEVMAVSWKYEAKIIAFSEQTFDFMKKIGTEVKRGNSPIKAKLKEKAGILIPLLIGQLFMDRYGVMDFVKNYQIEGIPLPLDLIPSAGLIIYGNDKHPLVNTDNKHPYN
jgi:hypothetical protein